MGQKVHPYIIRIGFGKDWLSRWFTSNRKEYADFLEEDLKIRALIKRNYSMGSIDSIVIERVSPTVIKVRIRTSRPGVIIGRRGQDIERVKAEILRLTKKEIMIDVEEVLEPATRAQLVAEMIAFQLMRRVNFRRAMKKAIQQATNMGCEGIKVCCSGRLDGAEIARSEKYKFGKIPLQTFRADIDYGFGVAKTTYGTIGVKAWIYKGEKNLGHYLITPPKEDRNDQRNRGRDPRGPKRPPRPNSRPRPAPGVRPAAAETSAKPAATKPAAPAKPATSAKPAATKPAAEAKPAKKPETKSTDNKKESTS
jgi:small subunit ribosomal protein S3